MSPPGSPTHQVEHGFHDVPVANLPDLDQAHQHGEFHLDIPYRDSGVDHPGREDHRAGCRHHPLPGSGGGASGGGGGASARGDLRLLSGGGARRRRRRVVGVSVCVRERGSGAWRCWSRLLARHFPLETGRRGAVAAVSHTCSTSCVRCLAKTIQGEEGRLSKNTPTEKGRENQQLKRKGKKSPQNPILR